jgi:flagellar biosynthesis chaperone FliJ
MTTIQQLIIAQRELIDRLDNFIYDTDKNINKLKKTIARLEKKLLEEESKPTNEGHK